MTEPARPAPRLLESLNRHRGKGAQKVTVEHVHVHEGGQAIVGTVGDRGGRTEIKGSCARHHDAKHEHGRGELVPVAGDEERSLPDARGIVAGSTEG
jgi:hypothetical protein